MIPDLPEGIDEFGQLKFFDTLSGNLSDQSTIHVHWWTHRQNPSVCWICDMTTLLSKVLALAMSKYTKSTVDIRTSKSQEEVSDTEIESDFNEPEYDVLDEEAIEMDDSS